MTAVEGVACKDGFKLYMDFVLVIRIWKRRFPYKNCLSLLWKCIYILLDFFFVLESVLRNSPKKISQLPESNFCKLELVVQKISDW